MNTSDVIALCALAVSIISAVIMYRKTERIAIESELHLLECQQHELRMENQSHWKERYAPRFEAIDNRIEELQAKLSNLKSEDNNE